ncbi:type II toxin-antitoxin system RelE/ParE family toxin [Nocardia sp. NPDC056541]|uniref:type II toxin-antitoxin system RelE/ParE family toxin n=1 Tax=Nocardia sp. NPDC056541 TaxID=3345860 RepID=UPI00366B26E1
MRDTTAAKPVEFVGRSLDELRDFPPEARTDAGHHIYLAQLGDTPPGSKPMPEIGRGVREIRIAENDGWFRVLYIAELKGLVWVLHCFQKKSNQIPKTAKDTGIKRYKLAVDQAKDL